MGLIMAFREPLPVRLPGLSESTNDEFVSRLNYGVLALKTKRVCVVEGYVTHIFHIELPQREPVKIDSSNVTECSGRCAKMNVLNVGVDEMTQSMRRAVVQLIDKTFGLVPEIKPFKEKHGRQPRALVGVVGDALSFLFGSATNSDVDQLRKEIESIKSFAGVAAADASRAREGVASFTRLTNESLEVMNKLMREESKALSTVLSEVESIEGEVESEYKAISLIALEISRFVRLHDSVQILELGVEELTRGHLSSNLIEVELLTAVLANISVSLRNRGLGLCFTKVRDVYNIRSFDVARNGQDLFIKLRLPYTALPWSNVYEISTLSLPVPGRKGWTTKINNIPKVILMAPSLGFIGELTGVPSNPVLDSTAIKWFRADSGSCIYNVLADDIKRVKQHCEFSTTQKVEDPVYIRVAKGSYVISKYSDVTVQCSSDLQVDQSKTECDPCMLTVGCGCTVRAEGVSIVGNLCPENSTEFSIMHAVNLIVLQNFYDITNHSLTGKTLFSTENKIVPQGVNWEFFGEKISTLLSADDTASYSLRKLANSLQNESTIFHTQAEALLSSYISEHHYDRVWGIELITIHSWSLLIVAITFCLILYLHCGTRRILRNHFEMIGQLGIATNLLRGANTQTIPFNVVSSTTSKSLDLEYLKTLVERDTFYFTVTLVLITISSVLTLYAVYRGLKRKSYVYLEFKTSKESYMIRYQTLPDATRCFDLIVPSKRVNLLWYDYIIFGCLKIEGQNWILQDTRTSVRAELPSRILVGRQHMRKLKELINDESCTLLLVFVHTHEHVQRRAIPKVAPIPVDDWV